MAAVAGIPPQPLVAGVQRSAPLGAVEPALTRIRPDEGGGGQLNERSSQRVMEVMDV